MDDATIFKHLGLALGLGLLVGIQRQWKSSELAGVRTFPLITLLGTLLATIEQLQSTAWLSAAGLAAVAAMLYVGNRIQQSHPNRRPGLTTEIAAIIMYAVGIAIAYGILAPSIALGGLVAVLLQLKDSLHRLVGRLSEQDLKAAMQWVLIAFVILPLLPNQTFGWHQVLNPYKIWLMVVLIVGISLVAYVAFKLLGTGVGALLGGVLGGLISSTATTVSYARQSRATGHGAAAAAFVIMLASTIVNARVMFEVFVVSPRFFHTIAVPLGIWMGVMSLLSVILFVLTRQETGISIDHENPAQLKPALVFGLLYGGILLIAAAAKARFGDQSLYIVAAISGLTDMDAITLSTAELVKVERLAPTIGWRVIMIAAISNLVFKGALAVWLGSRRLGLIVCALFALSAATGVALLVYWT